MSLKLQWALGSVMVLAMVLPGQAANQTGIGIKQQVRPLPAPQPATPVMHVKPNHGLNLYVLGGTGKREVVVPMSALPSGGVGTGKREVVISMSAFPPGGVGSGKREVLISMTAVGPDGVGAGKRELAISMSAVGPGGVGTGKRQVVIPMDAVAP